MVTTFRLRMYTAPNCGDCRRAKWVLQAHRIPFEEINIEEAPGVAEFVLGAHQGRRRVPTFEAGGRVFHCSPFDPDRLLRELRLS